MDEKWCLISVMSKVYFNIPITFLLVVSEESKTIKWVSPLCLLPRDTLIYCCLLKFRAENKITGWERLSIHFILMLLLKSNCKLVGYIILTCYSTVHTTSISLFSLITLNVSISDKYKCQKDNWREGWKGKIKLEYTWFC